MKKLEILHRYGYPFMFVILLSVVGCSGSSDDTVVVETVDEPDIPDPVAIDPNRPWNLIWKTILIPIFHYGAPG